MRSTRPVPAVALLLAACAQSPPMPPVPPASPVPTTLAGTAWQLVQVQSMDDRQGTQVVADPSRYTLAFGHDGRVSMRLDCNRAGGPWRATPQADGRSGGLDIGPLSSTRALCPPPSLDEKIARDMPHVRSYLLRDGRLHLSLMADGGIYSWAPLPP